MTQRPVMRKTSVADLAVPFVVIAVTSYVLLRSWYDSLPPLQYVIPLPIAVLAVIELVVARRVRMAVRHDPNARPITAINIARCVALGKASALVAAAVAGAAVGLLVRVLPEVRAVKVAANDARVDGLLLLASLLLVACGLVLERAGIDPNSDNPNRLGNNPTR